MIHEICVLVHIVSQVYITLGKPADNTRAYMGARTRRAAPTPVPTLIRTERAGSAALGTAALITGNLILDFEVSKQVHRHLQLTFFHLLS